MEADADDPNALARAVYLLDTNVISELRRAKPHGAVMTWLESVAEDDLHLSAMTLGEIQAGIELTRERDAARAAVLEAWLEQVSQSYNVVPIDAAVARTWARLMHRKAEALFEDAMIAASAVVHSLTVVTRNIRDFKTFDVPTLDPFALRPRR